MYNIIYYVNSIFYQLYKNKKKLSLDFKFKYK